MTTAIACGASDDDGRKSPSNSGAPALEYRMHRYFPGLEQWVTLEKSPTRAEAVLASGTRLPLGAADAQERSARRARFGALAPDFHAALAQSLPDAEVDVAVKWRLVNYPDEFRSMQAGAPNQRMEARKRHETRVATFGSNVAARLVAEGMVVRHISRGIPMIFGRARASDILRIARLDDVLLVAPIQDGTPEETASQVHPDTTMNLLAFQSQAGYTASGEIVGLVETGAGCRLRDDHVLFAGNAVDYMPGSFVTCSSNSQCNGVCDGSGPGICAGGKCVDSHGTQVASVVTQLLPQVRLAFPIAGGTVPGQSTPSVACSASAIDQA